MSKGRRRYHGFFLGIFYCQYFPRASWICLTPETVRLILNDCYSVVILMIIIFCFVLVPMLFHFLNRKPSFTTHLTSSEFLIPRFYQKDVIFPLISRSFNICLTYLLFHVKLETLKSISIRNGYFESFQR